MIVPAVLVVVLLAVVGAGLLGFGVLGGERGEPRSGSLVALAVPVGAVVGVVLLAALLLGVGGGGDHEDGTAQPATTATTSRTPISSTTLPRARVEVPAASIPVVSIHAADEDVFSDYRLVSGLAPGSVVRVLVEGFEWFEAGSVAQCVSELGRETACAESFPVQFDDNGRADFQFAVRGDVAPGGCRAGSATCLLRVTGNDTGRVAIAQTVLVDRVGPGRVTVSPARGVADGGTVEVSVSGFPAGTSATAVLCAPPAAYDARRCGPGTPASTFTIDAGGSGRTTLVVAAGRLGPDAVLCGPRRQCGVAVVVGPGFITAPPTPIEFSLGPGVDYDAGRLLTGVAIALVLLAVAVAIAVRTDWTKPSEAATPALDGSDLQAHSSLDEIFGTDEEIDERDPIPW